MPELRLYKSVATALWLLLGSVAFVGLGVLMLRQPDAPRLLAWLCIGFFGLGIPVSIYQVADRRPQIIVNEVGVFDRTIYPEFINWEVVCDVYVREVNRRAFICLVLDEAFEPSRTRGGWRRGLAQLNKSLGFQELNLNLAFVRVDALQLAELIGAMLTAEKPERAFLVRQAIENR